MVAFLAMRSSYIDRLYVDPARQRRGWGTRLLEHARALSPRGLELHTHVENHVARALYEKHGFVAVRFGVSPPPESAPDVEYHWRPEGVGRRGVAWNRRHPAQPPSPARGWKARVAALRDESYAL